MFRFIPMTGRTNKFLKLGDKCLILISFKCLMPISFFLSLDLPKFKLTMLIKDIKKTNP